MFRYSDHKMQATRFLLALAVFTGLTCVAWSPEQAGIRLSDPEVLKHHGTIVRPTLDEPLPRGKNLLWCATFQMAWDSASKHFGGPLKLKPDSPLAGLLNTGTFDRRWVDEDSVFTAEGLVADGVLDRIDQGAREKTGKDSRLLKDLQKLSDPTDLVFYALLVKDLEFTKPFAKLGKFDVGKRKVPWFGFTPDLKDREPLLEQVGIHHYNAKDDFVIELISKQTGDQLLLAKLPKPPTTPAAVSRSVLKHLLVDPPAATHNDLLAVPEIVSDEKVDFPELQGRTLVGSGRLIRSAMQTIDFRMDEKGAKLRSESSITFGCSAEAPRKVRVMVLDPPFAIVMKRKDAPQPYFVAWIANTDLLGGK